MLIASRFNVCLKLSCLGFPQVATTQPLAVTTCNIDMESLISDPNRSIATLAITTLLKVPPGPTKRDTPT